jgi:hypothetical protein
MQSLRGVRYREGGKLLGSAAAHILHDPLNVVQQLFALSAAAQSSSAWTTVRVVQVCISLAGLPQILAITQCPPLHVRVDTLLRSLAHQHMQDCIAPHHGQAGRNPLVPTCTADQSHPLQRYATSRTTP